MFSPIQTLSLSAILTTMVTAGPRIGAHCPLGGKRWHEFLVIGHAGGDPIQYCENTIESTYSALKHGANVIEIDLIMSQDNQIVLWHDADPRNPLSVARSLGVGVPGKCVPRTSKTPASELLCAEILRDWHQLDRDSGRSVPVVRLDDWLHVFAQDERIHFIWFDIKVEASNFGTFFLALERSLQFHSVPASKILALSLGSSDRAHIARSLMKSILPSVSGSRPSLRSSQVVEDTTSFSPWITGHVSRFNAIPGGVASCGTSVNLGAPPIALNRWDSIQRMTRFNVEQRNKLFHQTGNYIKIFVWTIDSEQELKWLLYSGVDGIITNKPGLLRGLINNKT
ncbi:hypothetical protein TCAL_14871 [Tigriopus californicus]|uniref:GP-PDE domain-containing protein n=1 Tax=Tigriopus californicus TaxID=6832 RepID=A0A553P3R9_TIGCA|nr:hypothetical protein TCAL_14871 [Tigriopus californicus]